ncbi:MAG: insulinase family protein [Cytophagales bacterium]|nr:insulinase family protein [Cytophagales bacterium]
MISYETFTLDNGLKVIVHEDHSTQMAVLNLLYDVGSRDEDENKTGFAHLFEHLMFGGSKNIPFYDIELQKAGGENNAFTSPDITNYYLSVPSVNIETGFWLESDRMLSLSFDPKALEVQRNVVIEEFKQRYLNQPYGDVWLNLNPLAFSTHPYKWLTIGKEISHIENATMDDVKDFFYRFYVPNNAILVVAGNVELENIKYLANKWFGPIPAGPVRKRQLPAEPKQMEKKYKTVTAKVPANAFYKAWHMGGRKSEDYYAIDLLSDMAGRGESSRLYQELVKKKQVFSGISAHISGSVDPGLFVVSGRLHKGITFNEAEEAVENVLSGFRKELVEDRELAKVKNQAETTLVFSEIELLNRAMNLAYSALLGDVEIINNEGAMIQRVTSQDIFNAANAILTEENSSVLHYQQVD